MRRLWLRICGAVLTFLVPLVVAGSSAGAESSSDTRIKAVLDSVAQMNKAILNQDAERFDSLLAPTLVVQNPLNRVISRDVVMKLFRNGQINFDRYDWTVDYAGLHGSDVIVMGEEIVHSKGKTFNSGKTSHLRFTDVWTNGGGSWKLEARQATVVSIE
jgi:Domain of unknown function (DUF4440)